KTPTAYAGDFLIISAFQQTGRLSFEVRYDKPYARMLMTWMGAILPKHLLEGQDMMTTPFARKPIGAGPYKLGRWDAGAKVTLLASDSYFEGRPYLDEAVYRIIPDPSTMFLELKAGRLDMMSLSPQQYLRQTEGVSWDRDWRKYRYLSFSYTFLGFNLSHPFFKDVAVRRAVSMAIDRQSLVDGVLLGQGVPTVGPYKPGTWAYNDKLTPVPQHQTEARRLLAEAGWKDTDGDGILDRDGKPFSFSILVNQGNDQRIKSAIIIQSQLREVGIDVRIRTVEWAAFIKEFVNTGRFDALILAWTITQDPDAFEVWHSSNARPGGLNITGYRNADVDALLLKARGLTDQAERKVLYDKFQEILHQEQPYCFLYVPYALPVIQARFQGIKPALGGIMYNFERWWVPKDLQRYHLQP
ncbi:MAG: peptide-binding protein, partial [Bilophila sp.]